MVLIICLFSLSTIRYIRKRETITKTVEGLQENAHEPTVSFSSSFMNLDSWIDDNSTKLSRMNESGRDESWCKELVLEIHDGKDNTDQDDICDQLGGRVCTNVKYSRIDIPANSKTTFYTSNGSILFPGHSYCLYKQPPIMHSAEHCDNTWGFWVYSPKYERWVCQSRVPGVYNGATHNFNNLCGTHGQLLFDGKPTDISSSSSFTPNQFYSQQFQERFSCDCGPGYIFDPQRSKTTCFKDPCLIGLPSHAAAKGYNKEKGGTCDCGPYFYNINGDETFPCTACPYNSPEYDTKNNTLTVFIKCKTEGESDFGVIPCETEQENILGCKKVVIKVKLLSKRVEEYSFEDRIFF